MKDQVVLRITAKIMIPFILVFGLYVITHGELGPGGGFQGGVILASAFILYAMIFGKTELEKAIPSSLVLVLAACGVLFYAGVGVWSMLAGGNFLDYAYITPSNPQIGEAWGMTLVEYGVGLTVCTIMIVIYNMITELADEEMSAYVFGSSSSDKQLSDKQLSDKQLPDKQHPDKKHSNKQYPQKGNE